MKNPVFHLQCLAATGTLSLALAPGLQAATTVIFDGFTGGTNNTAIGTNTFADNVTDSAGGVTASLGVQVVGTPNVDVSWNVAGRTDFYNNWDGRGTVAQLDTAPVQWSFTPDAGFAVKVMSYELDLWAGGGPAQIDWQISGPLSGTLASASWSRSAAGRDLITPNVTGLADETLTLSFTRVSGRASYLALDNLAFDQAVVPEPAGTGLAMLGLGAAAMRRRRRSH